MKTLRRGTFHQKYHQISWWERGDKNGLPVLLLHGGPGGGSQKAHREHFGPGWRVIHFDQRGCGKSTPSLEIRNNTTDFLIEDIEKIREILGIEKWVVCGGSWGSTLGLLYGQKHPERVLGFLLRGVFLCRQRDIDWTFVEGGASRIRPDDFAVAIEILSPKDGESLSCAFARGWQDPKRRLIVAKAWARWEDSLCNINKQKTKIEDKAALEVAGLENHYLASRGFIKENQILNNIAKIFHLPCRIVHGRYDLCCLIDQAYDLHSAWPKSKLNIVEDASHSAKDPAIQREMCSEAKALLKDISW